MEKVVQEFVEFWGKMGPNWGINRTMAQIHALLYCSEDPMDTDAIMERLSISRGNANINLRSLIDWNLVRKVHREGSRKDFFFAEKDVWHITAQIIRERQRQEIKPVKAHLNECIEQLEHTDSAQADKADFVRERLNNLRELMDVFEGFSRAILPVIQQKDMNRFTAFLEMVQYLQEESKHERTIFEK